MLLQLLLLLLLQECEQLPLLLFLSLQLLVLLLLLPPLMPLHAAFRSLAAQVSYGRGAIFGILDFQCRLESHFQ